VAPPEETTSFLGIVVPVESTTFLAIVVVHVVIARAAVIVGAAARSAGVADQRAGAIVSRRYRRQGRQGDIENRAHERRSTHLATPLASSRKIMRRCPRP